MFRKLKSWPAAIAAILISGSIAWAANTALSGLTAAGALSGANLIYVVQTVGSGGVKATLTQVATYINSLFSGDFTCTSGGACTLKNTGPGATGPIGSATTVPVVTIDAQGRTTALTSAIITQPSAANPTGTAGPAAVNGSAATFMRSDAAPAVQTASNSQKGLVQCDGTTIVCPSGTATAVPGVTRRTVTLSTDTILSTDRGNIVYYNSASAIAITQPAPTGNFAAGFFTTLCNVNTGVPTITPGSGTIVGGSTYAIPSGNGFSAPSCISYQSDGTNFNAAGNDLLPGSKIPSVIGATPRTVSGTTDTLASTDCGASVRYTSSSAVTVTIPQGLPVGCNIAVEQAGTAKVSVNGSAVTPATLHSAHSYTGTSGQYAVIGIFTDSSNVAILTGDGS